MSEEHTKDILNAHLLKGINLNFNTRLVQHRSLCHGWTILLENVACLVKSSASVLPHFRKLLKTFLFKSGFVLMDPVITFA